MTRRADSSPVACSLVECGNGFSLVNDVVVEPVSGEMWRVISIDSGVQTGDRMRGEANYVLATVTRAADVDDDAESICSVRFDR